MSMTAGTSIKAAFGARIVQALEKHDMSRAQLARLLDVDPSAVSRWTLGQGFPEEVETIDKMAAVLDTTPAWLVFGVEFGEQDKAAWHAFASLPDEKRAMIRQLIETLSK